MGVQIKVTKNAGAKTNNRYDDDEDDDGEG
jgi:hypothetical protein